MTIYSSLLTLLLVTPLFHRLCHSTSTLSLLAITPLPLHQPVCHLAFNSDASLLSAIDVDGDMAIIPVPSNSTPISAAAGARTYLNDDGDDYNENNDDGSAPTSAFPSSLLAPHRALPPLARAAAAFRCSSVAAVVWAEDSPTRFAVLSQGRLMSFAATAHQEGQSREGAAQQAVSDGAPLDDVDSGAKPQSSLRFTLESPPERCSGVPCCYNNHAITTVSFSDLLFPPTAGGGAAAAGAGAGAGGKAVGVYESGQLRKLRKLLHAAQVGAAVEAALPEGTLPAPSSSSRSYRSTGAFGADVGAGDPEGEDTVTDTADGGDDGVFASVAPSSESPRVWAACLAEAEAADHPRLWWELARAALYAATEHASPFFTNAAGGVAPVSVPTHLPSHTFANGLTPELAQYLKPHPALTNTLSARERAHAFVAMRALARAADWAGADTLGRMLGKGVGKSKVRRFLVEWFGETQPL